MSDDALTCPFCNARQTWRPGLAAGQRLACDRCGETFQLTTLPPEPEPAPTAFPTPRPKPVRANRAVAAAVLGVMLLTAGTGLTYALMTVGTRREHDKALPRKARRPADLLVPQPPSPRDQAVAPGELAGLGYLPESTGLVAAVLVEDLLSGEAGPDARSRAVRVGPGEFRLDSLKELLGVAVEEIDHVVLGVAVRDGDDADLTPPTQLVVRTKGRAVVALKASRSREERAADGGKRTLYSVSVRGVPATLWLADERTFVLGLFGGFDQVPTKPRGGMRHLRAELRDAVEKRVTAGTPAWVVGHSADWKKTWLPTLAATMKDVPLTGRLGEVKTFALWLTATKPPKVMGAFRCADDAAAARIEREELLPRAKGDALKYTRDGQWLDVQVTLR